MNINQVKYFAAAVELGSFSDTARKFSVTTQAVSKSIAELEREVGRELLVRDKSGVYPNQLGLRFFGKAAAALDAFAELERFAEENVRLEHSHDLELALCVPMPAGYTAVCDNIARILSKHLGIDINVESTSGEEGLKAMREGTYDALITIGTLARPGVECRTIAYAPPMVSFASDHPLAACQAVTMAQLADYPVGFFPIADRFNKSIVNMYLAKGLASPVRVIHRMGETADFLRREHGYTMSLALPVDASPLNPPDTVNRPFVDEDALAIPLCIAWLASRTIPHLDRLVELLAKGYSVLLG